jgi:putative transposase
MTAPDSHPGYAKPAQRLMGILGLAGMAPGPNTSRPHPQWSTRSIRTRSGAWMLCVPTRCVQISLTFRLTRGFVYLVAVID